MKICFISSLYPPLVIGGAEISVEKTAKELVKRGYEVIVITTSDRKNIVEKIEGVKIYRIYPLNLYSTYNHQKHSTFIKPIWHLIDLWNPHSYIIIKNILKKELPDIVHIHNFKGVSLSAFSAVKDLDLSLIFTAHDYSLICIRANLLNGAGEKCDNPSRFCRLYNKAQKYLVNSKPDIVTAPSQFIIDKLRTFDLFKSVETIKIPLGIESNRVKTEKKYDVIDILYAGALGRHKGVHILINAFKKLEQGNIRLHILGKGAHEDELKKIAGYDKRIRFHGFAHGKKLMDFYKKANITVVPSIGYENSPMVIYESLMNGIPVIGSNIGGIPELIEDGINGFLFESGNVNELTEILRKLIENPSKLNKLEKGTFESVKKYDLKKHVDKLEEIYKDLAIS